MLAVDSTEAAQLERLMRRDGIDEALARRMIERQARREERLAIADDVIANTGEEAALDAEVAALHQHYLALAKTRT